MEYKKRCLDNDVSVSSEINNFMEESIKSGYENIKKLRDGQISIEKRITNLEHCNKSTPRSKRPTDKCCNGGWK